MKFRITFIFILAVLTISLCSANQIVFYSDSGLNNNYGTPTIYTWGSVTSAYEVSDNNGHPYDPLKNQYIAGNPTWFGCGIYLGATVNLSSYYSTSSYLKFYLKLNRSLNGSERLKIQIEGPQGTNGTVYITASGGYGFNNSNATQWQLISIPLSSFSGVSWSSIYMPFKITPEQLSSSLGVWWDYVLWTDDNSAPSAPSLTYPPDGEKTSNQRPTFQWSSVSDPSGVKYWIQIDNNSDFSSPEVSAKGLTSTSFTPSSNLSDKTTFYWRVLSADSAGNIGSWSSSRKIIIDTSYIGAPTLVSPVNNIVSPSSSVYFAWSTVTNAVAYNIQVSENQSFSPTVVDTELSVSSYSYLLSSGKTYYWRVRAKNSSGYYSNWSEVRNFYILPISHSKFVVINDIGAAGYVGVYQGNSGSLNLSDDYSNYVEGIKSQKADFSIPNSDSYAGWYVEEGGAGGDETRYMVAYSTGHLYFWVKTSKDVQIAIRSYNIPAGNETSKVKLSELGVQFNNQWQEVSIPMSLFKQKDNRLDFSQMVVYFNAAVIGNISGTGSGTFWIDNVLWLSTATTVTPDISKVYQGLKYKQNSTTKLVRSFENIDRAVTYDQALAAMVFTYYRDTEAAKGIFNAYKNNIGWDAIGGYAEEYNVTNYSVIKSSRTTGPNLWMLQALMYYKATTLDTSYDTMISSLAVWLSNRQDADGGLKFGYDGSNWLSWKGTEHNLTGYAVFKNYAQLTGDNSFNTKADNIKTWLNNYMWVSSENRFKVGSTVPVIDKSLDCYSLAILAFPSGDYFSCINGVNGQGVDYYFKNTQTCQLTGVQVTGYDFGGQSGSNPDKDAVWVEGTGQMACAYYVANYISSATYFLNEIDKTIVEIIEGKQGLPYATNNGTAYGGWRMDAVNPCVSADCWYIFAKNKFNPLYPLPKFKCRIYDRNNPSVEKSSITWTPPSLPYNGWLAANEFIKIDCIPNVYSWGIQIYTDNFASDANPKWTGSTTTINCAGLICSSYTARPPLKLCWRLTDNTTNTLDIREGIAGDGSHYLYSQTLGSGYRCFFFMKDKHTPDLPQENTTRFQNGEDYIVIWDDRGGHHAEGSNWADMPTPNYLYLGCNFSNALTPAMFKTNKLTIEFFME